jgi:oxygen-independent coproporphyrinogen III oxidase
MIPKSSEYSLYIHVPFCVHRCAYCDFNTYAGQLDTIPRYVQAICREIEGFGLHSPKLTVGTIFFGGGTPSLLPAKDYQEIFKKIHAFFSVSSQVEVSLEANPGTVSDGYLTDLHSLGFNRISFGVQSANPEELHMLERIHSYSDVVDAMKWSRRAGFDNINLDLIYGLPEQSLERWQKTVGLVLGLNPEHISAYALSLEHGTPFGRWAAKGLLPTPDPDLAAEQYEWTMEYLAGLGYEQYEISNWAKSGRQCRHNLQYWRNLEYLGLGAGAHGYADGCRYSNVLRIRTYLDRMENAQESDWSFPLTPVVVNRHHNTPRENMQETMLTGLRLTSEGVSAQDFYLRFGHSLEEIFGEEIKKLTKLGLLEWSRDSLRLTVRGRLLGNQVFIEFVG